MLTRLAFLLDVDNTLLDNDAVKAHLQAQILQIAGESLSGRFWGLYEEVRSDLDAVSIPITLQRLRREAPDAGAIDQLAQRLFDSPFASFVYPGALDLLAWLRQQGLPVILSDGDPWFQAKKITDAGLGAAVAGNVLVFLHKELHVDDIQRWYPADRYVAVDDKARLLGLLKAGFGGHLTTIWVRQGHYAEADDAGELAPTDYSVRNIAGVRSVIQDELGR